MSRTRGGFLRHRRGGTVRATTDPAARGTGLTLHRPGYGELTTSPTGEVEVHREVIAASAVLVGEGIKRAFKPEQWQGELWAFYDNVGELRFSTRWLANAVSRCSLFIGTPGAHGEPVPAAADDRGAETARALLEALHHGQIGQAEMLRRMATHLSVPGETHLVGLDRPQEEGRSWYVASTDEISSRGGGKVSLTLPETGVAVELDPETSTVIRIWLPHPRQGWLADSALRATLPSLREVKGLSDHISASVDSRLAGAGVLFVPSGVVTAGGRPLGEVVMEAAMTAIGDRDDAAAVVPIIAEVEPEAIKEIKHVTFWGELSATASDLRKDALERFAAGADLPKEFVTGTGGMNHWGLAQLEDSAVKLYVEPLVGVICDALTQQYLWPGLRASGIDNPEQWVIWYSSAELTQRPNKAPDAQTLWNMGLLSDDAVRRESGFEPEDAPDAAEHERWLAERIALGSNTLTPTTGSTSASVSRREVPDQAPTPTPGEAP